MFILNTETPPAAKLGFTRLDAEQAEDNGYTRLGRVGGSRSWHKAQGVQLPTQVRELPGAVDRRRPIDLANLITESECYFRIL